MIKCFIVEIFWGKNIRECVEEIRPRCWPEETTICNKISLVQWLVTNLNVLYVFFWVFPRRPIAVCRRFGNLYQFHLQGLDVEYEVHPALEDGTDRVFRNVGIYNSDCGEIPKRIHTIFKTRRKFEIKNLSVILYLSTSHAVYISVLILMFMPWLIINTYVSLMYELNKKLERYLRVNLFGPGPRLMKKGCTGPRSHKCWETLP